MSYVLHTDKSSHTTELELKETFRQWGVADYQVDFNVLRSKHDNQYLSEADRAVTVRFVHPRTSREVVLSMADQATPRDNVRVLYLAIEDMRKIEKRGLGEVMESAYLQLAGPAAADCWSILGVQRGASRELIESAYRTQAKRAHPDATGGSNAAMVALNRARDEAIAEVSR